MAKTVLKFDTEEEFDFLLIGIVCQHKDYRLCHELNQKLELNLVREKDYEVNISRRCPPSSARPRGSGDPVFAKATEASAWAPGFPLSRE